MPPGEPKESSPQSVPEADPASSEVGPWDLEGTHSSHGWALFLHPVIAGLLMGFDDFFSHQKMDLMVRDGENDDMIKMMITWMVYG